MKDVTYLKIVGLTKMVRGNRWRWAAVVAAIVVLGAPAPSYAIFDWLCPSYSCGQTAYTTYVPAYRARPVAWAPRYATPVAVAYAPVAPTTCCYAPAASYQTSYRLAPVVSYRPTTCCSPCGGCATVSYRPVVVPYSTSRIVYASPVTSYNGSPCGGSCSAAPCGSCGSAAPCGSCGSAVSYGSIGTGCSSCQSTTAISPTLPPVATLGPSSVAPTLPANSAIPSWADVPSAAKQGTSSIQPMPSTQTMPSIQAMPSPQGLQSNQVTPSNQVAPDAQAIPRIQVTPSTSGFSRLPSSAPSGSSSLQSVIPGAARPSYESGGAKTFERSTPPPTEERLKPVPDSNTKALPAKIPDWGTPPGRTAQRVIRQAVYVQPVSYRLQSGGPASTKLDSSGWEAAGN